MKYGLGIVLAAILAIAAAGGYGWLSANRGQPADAASTDNSVQAGLRYTQVDNGNGLGLQGSSRNVGVRAWLAGPVNNGHTRTLVVRLKISKDWHVNANPASLKFLIPTVVSAEVGGQSVPIEVAAYPPGRPSDIVLGKTHIRVYDTGTTLNAQLLPKTLKKARSAGGLTVVVQAQACSNRGICLPTSAIRTRVPWS